MISDDLGKALHDKATRGLPLPEPEQTQLQSWYDEQDAQEAGILSGEAEVHQSHKLQAQIDGTLTQLMNMTRRIQEVMLENKTLRQEIESLRRQLVESIPLKKAV